MNRKMFGVFAASGLLIAGVLGATSAGAGPATSSVTGSIELASTTGVQRLAPEPLAYGGRASFAASVSGKLASRSYTYLNVVCMQNGKVVYQASNRDFGASFDLVDQAGDGLQWDGGAADCIGSVVYRIDGQKSSSISYLDTVDFAVAAST